MKTKSEIKKASKSLKAIADISRLSIVLYIAKKEMYVGQIQKILKIESTLLSHHLSILKDAGLIIGTRDGKRIVYSINPNVRIKGKNAGIKIGGMKLVF